MRGSMIFGMVAGSLIGATAALITVPYLQPEMQRIIRKGKRAMNHKMDKMANM
jgi:gas vesicle protein